MFADTSRPVDPGLPVFFNVHQHVGAGAPNQQDDVLLVQFLMVVSLRDGAGPRHHALYRPVRATGVMDAATLAAIRGKQEFIREQIPGTVVDGRISPVRDGKISYGASFHTLAVLNHNAKSAVPRSWPRLQDLEGCPPKLQDAIDDALGSESGRRRTATAATAATAPRPAVFALV